MALKLIITDFDGTLVDTFEANYFAYKEAFKICGLELAYEKYKECFGYRFDKFMEYVGIDNKKLKSTIRNKKKIIYPDFFNLLKPNKGLISIIRTFKSLGLNTAIASTATRLNLMNALGHIGSVNDFDLILSGESVSNGKPNPEIYLKILDYFKINPEETVVFEDSEIGCLAAKAAGIKYIKVELSIS